MVWFGAGAASAVYVRRKAQAAAKRLGPDHVATAAVEKARGRARQVRAAVTEGRTAMAEREAELRAELRQGVALGEAEVRQLRPVDGPPAATRRTS
jgi:hypothetical protein